MIQTELKELLGDDLGDSSLFKMIQVNSYCGVTGIGEFKVTGFVIYFLSDLYNSISFRTLRPDFLTINQSPE